MEVSGSISALLRGMECANVSRSYILGLPINDEKGNKIGEITRIEGDTWYGEVKGFSIRGVERSFSIDCPTKPPPKKIPGCNSCKKWGYPECPPSNKCFCTDDKPYYDPTK